MQIRAERATLKNFILTLFGKQTLSTAGLWENSSGEGSREVGIQHSLCAQCLVLTRVVIITRVKQEGESFKLLAWQLSGTIEM